MNKSLVRGSLVLLILFNVFNLLNFIFQFSMARMLTTAEYGILATLFSIVYILTVFSESIQTVIAKYTSYENDDGKTKNILIRSLRTAAIFASIFFLVFVLLSFLLSAILKIHSGLPVIIGITIFSAFLAPITRGVMQGKKRFYSLGINMVIEGGIKLILAVLFVALGFAIWGAVTAVVLGAVFASLLSILPLSKIFHSKQKRAEVENIWRYSLPVFATTLVVVLFCNIDIIIAKAVFPAETVGAYAIAAILAKILFVGTVPISKAMFPLSSENHANNKNSKRIFFNSLALLFVIAIVFITLIYFLKDLIIYLFAGRSVSLSAEILVYISIAMAFTSIANLVLLYKLSVGKVRGYVYLFIFILLEIGIMTHFSQDLNSFSIAFIISAVAFLIGSIILMNK